MWGILFPLLRFLTVFFFLSTIILFFLPLSPVFVCLKQEQSLN